MLCNWIDGYKELVYKVKVNIISAESMINNQEIASNFYL